MDRDTTVSVAIALADEIVIIMLQEDGTTEFADAALILEIDL